MTLEIVQAGDPVLRKQGRMLTKEEIASPSIQQLIELMRETMREAPGVGLAAPQIGLEGIERLCLGPQIVVGARAELTALNERRVRSGGDVQSHCQGHG